MVWDSWRGTCFQTQEKLSWLGPERSQTWEIGEQKLGAQGARWWGVGSRGLKSGLWRPRSGARGTGLPCFLWCLSLPTPFLRSTCLRGLGWGCGFVCRIKPICVHSGGGVVSTRKRQHSNHQTQPPPSPGSPDLGRLLSLKRTLTPSREAWAGGAMGDCGNNYCHHEKKAGLQRKRGEGPERGHVTSGVRGSRGFPPTRQRVAAGPTGPSETCHGAVSQWSMQAAWRLRNVSC